jgi:transcriptional regulator with XRE-family HTH domain
MPYNANLYRIKLVFNSVLYNIRVAELREIIGKSQTQFAAMIGVSPETIISVENARNGLSRKLAKKIHVATGADLWQETPGTRLNYTLEEFNRWRDKYSPSNETAALEQFEEMKHCLKVIFLAAAKSGFAGNRDRLPAVCLSFRAWLTDTRQHFKLNDEIEDALEDETREISRRGFSIQGLLKDPARAKRDLSEHDIDFNRIKKRLKKHAFGGWLIVEDEFRDVWGSSGEPFHIVCRTRKLTPRAKCWIKTLPPMPPGPYEMEQLMKISAERNAQTSAFLDEAESQDLLTMLSQPRRKSS